MMVNSTIWFMHHRYYHNHHHKTDIMNNTNIAITINIICSIKLVIIIMTSQMFKINNEDSDIILSSIIHTKHKYCMMYEMYDTIWYDHQSLSSLFTTLIVIIIMQNRMYDKYITDVWNINYDSDVTSCRWLLSMVMIKMMINISHGRDDTDDSQIRMVQMKWCADDIIEVFNNNLNCKTQSYYNYLLSFAYFKHKLYIKKWTKYKKYLKIRRHNHQQQNYWY
jgi:hypothetical protein